MSKKILIIAGGLFAVAACACVVLVVGLGVMSSDGDTPARSGQVASVAATPLPVAPSFAEIRQFHDTETEARWKDYRKQIEGTQVIAWRGWVDEVKGDAGHRVVHIDMDPPSELSVAEVSFPMADDVALGLRIDQSVTFTGEIDQAIDFMGLLSIELVRVTLSVD